MPRNEWRSVGDWRSPIVFSQCGDHLCFLFFSFRVWDSDCDCVKRGPEDADLLPLPPFTDFNWNPTWIHPKLVQLHTKKGFNLFPVPGYSYAKWIKYFYKKYHNDSSREPVEPVSYYALLFFFRKLAHLNKS